MRVDSYLWYQSLATLAVVAVLGIEAVRRKGIFCGPLGLLALLLWILLIAALGARTVWQLAEPRPTDLLSRSSLAVHMAALLMAVVAVGGRLGGALRGKGTGSPHPLRLGLTWAISAVLLVLVFPLVVLYTRLLIRSNSAASRTRIPITTLLDVARVLVEGRPTWESPSGLRAVMDPAAQIDGRPAALVVFRGSRNLNHWKGNVSVGSAAAGDCCRVHAGWMREFEEAWRDGGLRDAVMAVLERARASDRPLIVSGYSLGGAMAQLLVFRLLAEGQLATPTSMVLFASPTAGDAAFVERISAGLDDFANVIMPLDPVPVMSDAVFAPLGNEVVVMPAQPNRLLLGSHLPENYLEALRAAQSGNGSGALLESMVFVAGLAMLLTGLLALIFAADVSAWLRLVLVLAAGAAVWQLAQLLVGSGAASYAMFGVGLVSLTAGLLMLTFYRAAHAPSPSGAPAAALRAGP